MAGTWLLSKRGEGRLGARIREKKKNELEIRHTHVWVRDEAEARCAMNEGYRRLALAKKAKAPLS